MAGAQPAAGGPTTYDRHATNGRHMTDGRHAANCRHTTYDMVLDPWQAHNRMQALNALRRTCLRHSMQYQRHLQHPARPQEW
eukprot:1160590-Pelagomonas_calceolata.AAC.14